MLTEKAEHCCCGVLEHTVVVVGRIRKPGTYKSLVLARSAMCSYNFTQTTLLSKKNVERFKKHK